MKKKSKVSLNRQLLAFLKSKKVDIDYVYGLCLERGLKTYEDYEKECIRIAQDHSWLED